MTCGHFIHSFDWFGICLLPTSKGPQGPGYSLVPTGTPLSSLRGQGCPGQAACTLATSTRPGTPLPGHPHLADEQVGTKRGQVGCPRSGAGRGTAGATSPSIPDAQHGPGLVKSGARQTSKADTGKRNRARHSVESGCLRVADERASFIFFCIFQVLLPGHTIHA